MILAQPSMKKSHALEPKDEVGEGIMMKRSLGVHCPEVGPILDDFH
jgi:hypothetical protein